MVEYGIDGDNLMVTCECGLRMPYALLTQHRKSFHTVTEIGCNLCDRRFDSAAALQNHKAYDHLGQTFSNCRCRDCLNYLNSKHSLAQSSEFSLPSTSTTNTEESVDGSVVSSLVPNCSPNPKGKETFGLGLKEKENDCLTENQNNSNLSMSSIPKKLAQKRKSGLEKAELASQRIVVRNLRSNKLEPTKEKPCPQLEGNLEKAGKKATILNRKSKRCSQPEKINGKRKTDQIMKVDGLKKVEEISIKTANKERSTISQTSFVRNLRSGNLMKGKVESHLSIPSQTQFVQHLGGVKEKDCAPLESNLENVKNKRSILSQKSKKGQPLTKLNQEKELRGEESNKKSTDSQCSFVRNLRSNLAKGKESPTQFENQMKGKKFNFSKSLKSTMSHSKKMSQNKRLQNIRLEEIRKILIKKEERERSNLAQKQLDINMRLSNLVKVKEVSPKVESSLQKPKKQSSSSQNKFNCYICKTVYSCQGNLTQHVKNVHKKLRPFKCAKCLKGYSSKQKLERHFVVHSQTRDIGCPNCPKMFRTKDVMRKHLNAIHLGKIYPCKICKKFYHWPERLYKHLKEHKGNVKNK